MGLCTSWYNDGIFVWMMGNTSFTILSTKGKAWEIKDKVLIDVNGRYSVLYKDKYVEFEVNLEKQSFKYLFKTDLKKHKLSKEIWAKIWVMKLTAKETP